MIFACIAGYLTFHFTGSVGYGFLVFAVIMIWG